MCTTDKGRYPVLVANAITQYTSSYLVSVYYFLNQSNVDKVMMKGKFLVPRNQSLNECVCVRERERERECERERERNGVRETE